VLSSPCELDAGLWSREYEMAVTSIQFDVKACVENRVEVYIQQQTLKLSDIAKLKKVGMWQAIEANFEETCATSRLQSLQLRYLKKWGSLQGRCLDGVDGIVSVIRGATLSPSLQTDPFRLAPPSYTEETRTQIDFLPISASPPRDDFGPPIMDEPAPALKKAKKDRRQRK